MNEVVVANRASDWLKLKALVLDSVSSPITRRVYNLGLDEFIARYGQEFQPAGFTKATVTAWRVSLEARKLGPISINLKTAVDLGGRPQAQESIEVATASHFTNLVTTAVAVTACRHKTWAESESSTAVFRINVRITAVRKLAVEAADNGLLAPELASGIARIKGVKSHGIPTGNWLSLQQAQRLLNTPDVTTKKGLRDRAMFAVLLGCGLRRSKLANLTVRHVQQRDNR